MAEDPAIFSERIEYDTPDGALPAFAAWPTHSIAQTPSVVVVMHLWGVDASIRDAVLRFAHSGFAAIAPDLYGRFDAPDGDGSNDSATFRAYAQRLERAQYLRDLAAAARLLSIKFPRTKTALVGFCLGGRIALRAAVDVGDVFAAVCPFYGALTEVDPADIRIPLCGSYGELDAGIPAETVRDFAARLHVPNDVRVYERAGHAFCDGRRASYVETAAEDAWTRTVEFLRAHLGQPTP